MNLDKWPAELVEMYKHVNNALINSYWEARLPRTHDKPGPGTSPNDVEAFIRDKYINKKWIDTNAKADPANLYWNDRKSFEKYRNQFISGG